MGWWSEITAMEQVLYVLAAASTILLLIQTVLSMLGLDSDREFLYKEPSDAQNPPKKSIFFFLFTVRGLLSFSAIGSWTTIVLFKATTSWVISFCVGLAAGIATLFLVAAGFLRLVRIPAEDSHAIYEAIGAGGEVYATVPPKGEGKGKVSVKVQNEVRVYKAIAYEDKKIPASRPVRILDVVGEDTLLVERR